MSALHMHTQASLAAAAAMDTRGSARVWQKVLIKGGMSAFFT